MVVVHIPNDGMCIRVCSLHNATNRFLDNVGRAGGPNAPLADWVRAAFPPRG